jgi:serine protease Do
MDQEQKRFKKLSGAQFFAVMLLTFIIGSLSGFVGGISGLVALDNENFQKSFPIFKDLKLKERVEKTLRVFSEQRKVIETSETIDAIKKVKPSVVSIIVRSSTYDFFWGEELRSEKSGTGFFVTNDGLIATNKHVVLSDTDKQEIVIITDDGEKFEAEVKAIDPSASNDLAFIKIIDTKEKSFPILQFADSEDVQVGQKVIAIGNALGENDNTATQGIVSAMGKRIVAGGGNNFVEVLEGVLQVSAAINPGNSGGPLIDLDGNVIGINTAGSTNAELVNYAIPSNAVKPALDKFLKEGEIDRAYLGVYAETVTKSMKAYYDLSDVKGAMIVQPNRRTAGIVKDGPADRAGLKERDIILSIDGVEITPDRALSTVLLLIDPKKKVELRYLRDGEERKTEITLGSALEQLI